MDEKNEEKLITNEKRLEGTKNSKRIETKSKDKNEVELITAYTQVVIHTLKHSGTEMTPKTIREEVQMFYTKFGNDDVKELAKAIVKGKKERE